MIKFVHVKTVARSCNIKFIGGYVKYKWINNSSYFNDNCALRENKLKNYRILTTGKGGSTSAKLGSSIPPNKPFFKFLNSYKTLQHCILVACDEEINQNPVIKIVY
jgi:hypothetical protein